MGGNKTWGLWLQGLSTLVGLSCWGMNGQVLAQIVGDRTLPNNSLITIDGNRLTINGGTAAGSNLFHSFQEFSVPTGSEAFFNNATNVSNIISRITGSKITNIDGLIRANGTANLFLLNPNGIIFGPNARLDIGGSFIGTTANSIEFSDGRSFSATPPNNSSLLTINVPIGLQLRNSPGTIQVTGRGHDLQISPESSLLFETETSDRGLQVKPGNTLALVGGDLLFDGGKIKVESGRIELGSVRQGNVSLTGIPVGWEFGYENVSEFGKIEMRSQSLVEAVPLIPSDPSAFLSGVETGESTSIIVRGDRLQLRDGSLILSQTLGLQPSGNININAAQSIELTGINREGTIRGGIASTVLGTGQSGEISISTRRLVLREYGGIASFSLGAANSSNITINALKDVQIVGASPEAPTAMSSITTTSLGTGDAGDIFLSTETLRLRNGGNIVSTTNDRGKGGDVTVNATESIEVIGVQPTNFAPSTLSASTINAGNAGNLIINTGKLIVQDGGRVDSSTVADGDAGNVIVNASEFVAVSGTVPGSVNPSLIISSANIIDESLQQFLGLPPIPSGKAGNVTIDTPRLSVGDGAQVTVRNDGTGDAGSLRIMAGNIFLDSEGSVNASTESGQGGNINLQVANSLQLRDRSQISAEARGAGNGGNLTINANTIVALENSDIIANAVAGAGGNITISTQGIFGTQFRPQLTPESDITASSQLGVSGTVNITTPEVDPSSAVVELPEGVIDPDRQIVSGCHAGESNTFTITGRGGLPAEPMQTILGQTVWQDWQDYTRESRGNIQQGDTAAPRYRERSSHQNPMVKPLKQTRVIEATGWVKHPNGAIELVAQRPNPRSVLHTNCANAI